MKKQYFLILTIALFHSLSNAQRMDKRENFRLFYLGGQSNMSGFGKNVDLPKALKSDLKDVWIFQGNTALDGEKNGGEGIWEPMKPGHGNGFSSDGKKNNYSKRFGPELSFAKKMKELYPNDKIAIIKYSRSGSSIDSTAARQFGCWEPDFKSKNGINQYDHFLKTISNATEVLDIDQNGKLDKLIPSGIVWMQGESDAFEEEVALRYYNNLKRLMDLIRATLRTDDLPIALGKISDSGNNEEEKVWQYGELVQYAQEKFALTDENTTIVRSTKAYKYSDPYHYDSDAYIDFGIKLAEAIYHKKKE